MLVDAVLDVKVAAFMSLSLSLSLGFFFFGDGFFKTLNSYRWPCGQVMSISSNSEGVVEL